MVKRIHNLTFAFHNLITGLLLCTGILLTISGYYKLPIDCEPVGEYKDTSGLLVLEKHCLRNFYARDSQQSVNQSVRPENAFAGTLKPTSHLQVPSFQVLQGLVFLLFILLWFYFREKEPLSAESIANGAHHLEEYIGKGWWLGIRHLFPALILLVSVLVQLLMLEMFFGGATDPGITPDALPFYTCDLDVVREKGSVKGLQTKCVLPLEQTYSVVLLLDTILIDLLAVLAILSLIRRIFVCLPGSPMLLVRCCVDPRYKCQELNELAAKCSFGDWLMIRECMDSMYHAEFKAILRSKGYSEVLMSE